ATMRFGPDVEPIVRLIEDTPRDKCVAIFLDQLRCGLPYRRFLAAVVFAPLPPYPSPPHASQIPAPPPARPDPRPQARLPSRLPPGGAAPAPVLGAARVQDAPGRFSQAAVDGTDRAVAGTREGRRRAGGRDGALRRRPGRAGAGDVGAQPGRTSEYGTALGLRA